MPKKVFVFGSNEAGIHGAGAAKHAYEKCGARWGFSYGHCGDSFAIPTKDNDIQTLELQRIRGYVHGFCAFAAGHPKLTFQVTRIGCGLAGLEDRDIAPMFFGTTKNVLFDEAWKPIFDKMIAANGNDWQPDYWGTF